MTPPAELQGTGRRRGHGTGRRGGHETGPRRDPPHAGRLDPGRLAVMQDSFDFVCEEMGRSLRRTAFSPNIKERLDASCALFDPSRRMFAQAEHIPVHLGSMPMALELMVGPGAPYPQDGLEDGDQLVTNDPSLGGSHLPDITVVKPVFRGGAILGFCVNRAHHADVGGTAMGSLPPSSTRLEEEGMLIPPTRVMRGGRLDGKFMDGFLSGTVTGLERKGDLMAQIGANELGARWLKRYVDKFGAGTFRKYVEDIMENARARMAGRLSEVPDGKYRAMEQLELPAAGLDTTGGVGQGTATPLDIGRSLEGYWATSRASLDASSTSSATAADGPAADAVPAMDERGYAAIAAEVTVEGDRITVDFEGTSPQLECNLNAPFSVVLSCVYYVLRSVLDPGMAVNAGSLAQVDVRAPRGSLLDPEPGAAVAAGNVETSQRIVDVLLRALAPALPDRVPAGGQGTMNNLIIGGYAGAGPAGAEVPFTYYETIGGGEGAYPFRDGQSGIHVHMTNTGNTPAEAMELSYPLMVVENSLRDGSGGPGSHAGGSGMRRAILFAGTRGEASIIASRRKLAPRGGEGGGDGSAGRDVLLRNGRVVPIPGQARVDLAPGDILVVDSPGGGGWGGRNDRG